MSKVLYIKANTKPEGQSRTFRISDSFINEYKKNNPNDEIITLDLYEEDIDFLKGEDVGILFAPKNEESKDHRLLKYAYQFKEVDKYVLSAPMWNLSVPAIVKAYIDYVCIMGITFKYTESGPAGLCQGKKAVLVSSRGGNYSQGEAANYEMGERYLRTIFGFFGISDVQSISAEGLDVQGNDVEKIIADSIAKAEEMARQF